jgi:hypothetical protein
MPEPEHPGVGIVDPARSGGSLKRRFTVL